MGDGSFFVASKIFWLLARPESVLVGLIVLSIVFSRRVFALVALCLMLAIGALPVSDWLLLPLEKTYPANPDTTGARGVIVLGGASVSGISRQWDTVAINEHGERFLVALSLLSKEPGLEAIFTGGSGSLLYSRRGEAASAERILLSTGLDPERLRIEGASRNTWENAMFTKDMLGPDADDRWILITSAWHMRRSVETFCAAGWKDIVPYPADYLSVEGRAWPDWYFAARLQHVNLAIKEWIGLWAYRSSGRAGDAGCANG